jgi:hypothetical protein
MKQPSHFADSKGYRRVPEGTGKPPMAAGEGVIRHPRSGLQRIATV